MDLRPASVLEAEESRGMELRRRREPMAVTTRIRMVGQPPGGLLPLSLFDHVSLADRMAPHPCSMETVGAGPCWSLRGLRDEDRDGRFQTCRVPYPLAGCPSGQPDRRGGSVAGTDCGLRRVIGAGGVPAA